jgi:hypothetical protein
MEEIFGFNPEANTGLKKEDPEEKETEIRENAEKVRKFLETISKKLRSEGLPITEGDCRINMNPFKNKDIKKDKEYIKRIEKKIEDELKEDGLSIDEIKKRKLMADGERFERLKTVILHKAFGKDFIVARSSRYDDIKNRIDNIIIEKETGNVVCAVDDITTKDSNVKKDQIADFRFKDKKEYVARKNKKDGAELKYGISVEKGRIVKKNIRNLPVFCISLSPETLKKTEKNLISSLNKKDGKSQEEEDFIFHFLFSIKEQIEDLEKKHRPDSDFGKNLAKNKEVIEKLKGM